MKTNAALECAREGGCLLFDGTEREDSCAEHMRCAIKDAQRYRYLLRIGMADDDSIDHDMVRNT